MHCLFRGRVVPEKYYTLASKLQPWREESDLAFLTHPLKFLMRHPPEIFQLRSLRTVLSFVGQGTSPNDAHGSGPREGLVGDRGLRRDVLILGINPSDLHLRKGKFRLHLQTTPMDVPGASVAGKDDRMIG